MKYITILLLIFVLACENKPKQQEAEVEKVSTKDMELYVDENSLVKIGDTSEIWVKRVFPEGKIDQVTSLDTKGNKKVYDFDGIASLILFDCGKKVYIVDEIYYFMGDNPVTEMINRSERLEDKALWSHVQPGDYISKVYDFVCKPASE